MKVTIVAVGKLKEKYFVDGIAEYGKRISRFAELRIVECNECPAASSSAADVELSKRNEGKGILAKLNGYVIALAIEGKELSSPELSEHIESVCLRGVSEITFVIGGSCGLSGEVLERADFLLSFGKVTYPHQLMRLILTEQIYRAFAIQNHLPYHK